MTFLWKTLKVHIIKGWLWGTIHFICWITCSTFWLNATWCSTTIAKNRMFSILSGISKFKTVKVCIFDLVNFSRTRRFKFSSWNKLNIFFKIWFLIKVCTFFFMQTLTVSQQLSFSASSNGIFSSDQMSTKCSLIYGVIFFSWSVMIKYYKFINIINILNVRRMRLNSNLRWSTSWIRDSLDLLTLCCNFNFSNSFNFSNLIFDYWLIFFLLFF